MTPIGIPLHFYPAPVRLRKIKGVAIPLRLPLPSGAVAPCGTLGGGPTPYTDDPLDVTCRRCVRSRLVQRLLAEGYGGERVIHYDDPELARLGLLRFPRV